MSISERRESSLAILSADNLSKNLQKIAFFTPKRYKNSSETEVGIRAVLLFAFEQVLTLLVWGYCGVITYIISFIKSLLAATIH